ncbi:hypothetical protein VTN77DRAFT_2692 [Rasamsonia byssochlamydoides]|uniref:uncharacterized protein n=1 Tax=Rasamsonia byssochlamydoides TaxID=89139 RepID=UPI003742054C
MPLFTSPFPTSHDTIGTSTLMPSSPPPQLIRTRQNPKIENGEKPATRRQSRDADAEDPLKENHTSASRVSSSGPELNELDKRLAQYTIDWSKLPDGEIGDKDHDPEPLDADDDKDSSIGGPEDFTMNIEKYILGNGDSKDRRREDPIEKQGQQRLHSRSPPAQQNAEEGEYSEFGPPVDMSTPSHLLRRKNLGTGKEGTHLEDIEEHLADSPGKPGTPSKPTSEKEHPEDDTFSTVLREIEHLQDELRDRDAKIRENQQKALEAESAAEEIRHLRAELQRKNTLLSKLDAKRAEEEALLHEQIQALQKQNDEKERLLQESKSSSSKVEALQQQIDGLKAELRKRDELASSLDESTKTIASLRQQLSDAHEQLKKRDEALEDSTSKLREMAANTELQLREKNTEIENLKAQLDDRELEMCHLEENLAEVNREYDVLEERIGMLENRNRPLEEKNIALEAEVNRAKSEIVAQKNALSSMAANFSIETDGKTYNEILDSLKAWCQSKRASDASLQEAQKKETDELRTQIAQLQAESKTTASAKESLELELKRSQELITESRALITTIESENTRLTSRLNELNSDLAEAREELKRAKEERSRALETIERLSKGAAARPPSPARSTIPTPQESNEQKYRALKEAHQVEIKNLQDAHASAISTLRKSYTGTADNLRAQLAESEKREADLRAELRALRNSASSHEREVSRLTAEMKRLESVLAIKEEAAADVDRRIARSVEKREREWERRIDLLLKERDKMSKALLWAWGEKEVGRTKEPGGAAAAGDDAAARGPKQGYRYKYVRSAAS